MENRGEIILYQTEDGLTKLNVNLRDEMVWLSLDQMAELLQRDKSTISWHIHNIFSEGELNQDSVVAKFATTAADGKTYQVEYYNLDVIISVGYRVKSQRGTQFRVWANSVLKEDPTEGLAMDEVRRKRQMSEALLTAAFLCLSGGLQDAYTYLARGRVFANAQTGNIVLFSTNLLDGDWPLALRYLVPVLAFALGVAAAEGIRWRFQKSDRFHWRQTVLLGEIVLLFAVGFLPEAWNDPANAVVSFCCAMQVQAFRKIRGDAFASTMCIGNLRSGVESLTAFTRTRNRELLKKSARYFGIILLFALGAGAGGFLLPLLGLRTIWISCGLLAVSFGLMLLK